MTMTTTILNTAAIDLTNAPAASNAPFITDIDELRSPKGEVARAVFAEFMAAKGRRKKGGLTGASEGRRKDSFFVSPYELKIVNGFNARYVNSPRVQLHIDAIARSIAAPNAKGPNGINGVKEALKVFVNGNDIEVTNGECRLRAVFRAIEVYGARVDAVQVTPEDRYASKIERLYTQSDSNLALPFTMLENGELYVELTAEGQSVDEIASRCGKTGQYVRDAMMLAGAPAEAKAKVDENVYTSSALLGMLKKGMTGDLLVKAIDLAHETKVRSAEYVKAEAAKAAAVEAGETVREKKGSLLKPRDLAAAAEAVMAGQADVQAPVRANAKTLFRKAVGQTVETTFSRPRAGRVRIEMDEAMFEALLRAHDIKAEMIKFDA
jgi:hypothetical protein